MSDQPKYVPQYEPEDVSDVLVGSGVTTARQNISIKEAEQRRIAESPKWQLAKRINPRGDSRAELEALGFKVVSESDELFYEVEAPAGWQKSTSGFWTTVTDETGKKRISQFFKGAWYDRDAFLNFS